MEPHTSGLKDILSDLKTDEGGISPEEAGKRLLHYGPNSVAIRKEVSPIAIFIGQFKNLLVLLLIAAALVSLALSYLDPAHADVMDAILIFAIVIANAVFGFLQEYKAEKTMEALTDMSAPRASVIRGGREIEIRSEEVVPGDILILTEGDKVAADARLMEAFSLYADESMLTGESVPARKKTCTLEEKTPLAERSNLVFMNSVVTRGRATAVVVRTGLSTEVGKIAREIAEAPEKITRFQVEIEDVGKKVSILTIGILVVIAASEFLMRTGDILFIFLAAVALGVAAIPEGLPAVVTLTLSIATNRMLKEKALMRRLATVQDLGSADVICTDKTGTLTENVMTVTRIYADGRSVEVSGKGLGLEGKFVIPGSDQIGPSPYDPKGPLPGLADLLRCAVLCNDARMVQEEGKDRFKGDPTEIAILIPAYKAKMDVVALRAAFKRVGEVPFSPERKLMSTANRDGKATCSFVKGAPEVLLSRCATILDMGKRRKLSAKDREEILSRNDEMASSALRVLGFAYKDDPKSFEEEDMEEGLVFLGLMGMRDPPREGVKEAIEDCRKAGIRTIMVTGDNRHTAEAIAHELGFSSKSLTGDELDSLSEGELARVVEEVDVYARTSPRHKVLLLKALQKNNHSVCMTGDGVNDAAAIKNSDVGIAMGIRGTEVTKQASDMVVLDDNFITIRNAVAQGRGTFDNIRKFVAYLLGANISEVLIVFLASVLSLGISPKIAIQLLWINLVTDGLPALALGVDSPAKGIMQRRPRKKEEPILDDKTLYFIITIGISATIALILLYAYMLRTGDAILAQSALFSTFVIMEMLIVYVVRWKYGADLSSNKWLHIAVFTSLLLQAVILYTPLNAFFGITPLGISELEEIGASLLIFLVLLSVSMKAEPFFMKTGAKAEPLKGPRT
jgi:Ca2+-transporting ATPase